MAALTSGHAAGRTDSQALTATPTADITDLYAWMIGANLNLVMDVSPMDDGTHSFDPGVLYVFHLTSKAGLGVGAAGGAETRVICKFASNTSVACWVADATGTRDYVTGDPSNTAGVTSLRGKVRVFAGRRSDPMFFNQSGFAAAVPMLKAIPVTPPPDAAGCPQALDVGGALTVRNLLHAGGDTFATANVLALVVQIDKSLVNTGSNTTVAVWGSTHAGS